MSACVYITLSFSIGLDIIIFQSAHQSLYPPTSIRTDIPCIVIQIQRVKYYTNAAFKFQLPLFMLHETLKVRQPLQFGQKADCATLTRRNCANVLPSPGEM